MPTGGTSTAEAPRPGPAAPSRWRDRVGGFDRRFPRGRLMLLLTGLVLVLNVTTALKVDKVSLIDERYWIDHLVHGAKFSIDRAGVPIDQETVREICERGIERDPFVPKCHPGHLNPAKYGYWHGINITGHSPFYFFVTGPIARVLRATPLDLGPNDSLVSWARILGSAWLLLGIYFILRAGELLGVDRFMLACASIFAAATPALLHADTIVTPDATAVPTGAAVLFAALVWERSGKPKHLWILAGVSVLGAAMSPKNGLALVLVLVYFALRALGGWMHQSEDADEDAPKPWKAYATIAIILGIALFLGGYAWDEIYAWMQRHIFDTVHLQSIAGNPIERSYGNRSISFWQIFGVGTVFMMFPPFNDVAFPHQRTHEAYQLLAKLSEYVAIGAMFAVALRDKLAKKLSVLGFATLITLLISPTLTVLRNQAVGGTFDQPIWRYGLSIMPALVIVIAAALRTKFSRYAFTALTAALYLVAIYVLFRPPPVLHH